MPELLSLALICYLILVLIKNALGGKQLNREDTFLKEVDLIIPIFAHQNLPIEQWLEPARGFNQSINFSLKVYLLINGHHPQMHEWEKIKAQLPFIEIQSFLTTPEGASAGWFIEQVKPRLQNGIVIVGSPELIPDICAIKSLASNIVDKERRYLVFPQHQNSGKLLEAVGSLDLNLAMLSLLNFKALDQQFNFKISSFCSIWFGMKAEEFKAVDFKSETDWKNAILNSWSTHKRAFHLAFGEKLILKATAKDLNSYIETQKDIWKNFWSQSDKTAFFILFVITYLWSMPLIWFFSNIYCSIASFVLLLGYRFFTKIVFQEKWSTLLLHPLAAISWNYSLGLFIWEKWQGRKKISP